MERSRDEPKITRRFSSGATEGMVVTYRETEEIEAGMG